MFETLYAVLDRATVFDGARQVQYARMRGRHVLESGTCPVDQLADFPCRNLRVAIVSPLNYCQRISLDVFRRSLVPFVARRQLEQDAIFSDRFRLRTEVLSLRDGKAEACVVACLDDDAEMAMDSLPVEQRPLTRLALAESAVAALVGQVTRAPVLALWYRAGVLTSLGVAQSRVLWQRTQRVDAAQFIGAEQWRTVVERAVAAAPAEFTAPHGLRLNLGDGPWRQTNAWAMNGSQFMVGKLSQLFQGVPAETVLATPELYGLPFVPGHADLLDNDYSREVDAWKWGVPAAAAAACIGLALGGVGLMNSMSAERTRADALAEAAPLVARHAQVQAALPSDAAVRELGKVLDMNDVLTNNVRVDDLLARVAAMVPPQVRLKRIEIGRHKPGRITGVAALPAGARTTADSQYFMDLEVVLKGSYGEGVPQAEVLTARLAELGTLEGTRFEHTNDRTRDAQGPHATYATRILLSRKAMP